jgi:hypothetical protein
MYQKGYLLTYYAENKRRGIILLLIRGLNIKRALSLDETGL